MSFIVIFALLALAIIAASFLVILIVLYLVRKSKSAEVQKVKGLDKTSIAETLKENRIRCNMTQEFVAEQLGVSRQAVSKWENGTSDPNTSNLIALAKLYGTSPEELLEAVQ